MTIIQFYHLTVTPFERALPKLLEKAYGGGFKILVVASSETLVEQLDQLLWTYDPNAFLPHGSKEDGHSAEQPVLLSTTLDMSNQPTLLVVTDGRQPEQLDAFARVLDMFDGRNSQDVANARTRWAAYKKAGHELTYFQQTEQGGWEQKGVA